MGWRNDKIVAWKHVNEGRCWAGLSILGSNPPVTTSSKEEGWGSADQAHAGSSWWCKQWMCFSELNTLNCAWSGAKPPEHVSRSRGWIYLLLLWGGFGVEPHHDEVLGAGLLLMQQILSLLIEVENQQILYKRANAWLFIQQSIWRGQLQLNDLKSCSTKS